MVIGNALGWGVAPTVALSVTLAFMSGYALSTLPLVRRGMSFVPALKLVFVADTLSILTMEIVNNAVMVAAPGAMAAHVLSFHFWGTMFVALAAAFVVAFPVNLVLLGRGKGHALMHDAMGHGHDHHDHHDHHRHHADAGQ